jgi:rod shape determining protein RodA
MLRIDRRLVTHFEWPLLCICLLIAGCGLLTIFSATYVPGSSISSYVVRQASWIGVGLVFLLLTLAIDYRILDRFGLLVYAGVLALLILVPLIGSSGGGARRWLSLGPVSIQPSEFMKVALVIVMAAYLHRWAGDRRLAIRRLILPALLIAVPAYLVLAQPDLGTVIVICATAFMVLLFAGFPLRLVLLAVLVMGPALPYAWNHLKPYQRQRIVSYVNPQSDPLGAGYHARQSKIAIGSGMVYGKGYLRGTQNQLRFLPEHHTDFVFSVFAEEWGFLGTAVLLALYVALLVRGAMIAFRARDNLGALLAAGLTATIVMQAAMNLAMTTGLLPVVGITLPFLSYGGSSMLALMVSVGLIMNVSMRRFTFS